MSTKSPTPPRPDTILYTSSALFDSNTTTNNDIQSINDNEHAIYHLERQLFLRAALQLLDEKEMNNNNANNVDISKHNTTNNNNNNTNNITHLFRGDVLRFGRLKKANRRNAISSMAPRVWKNKIVEIKYGVFYYEDECNITTNNRITDNNNDNICRKSIILSPNTTSCREVKTKGVYENCIFKLETIGGAKRTFLASTPEDRDAWMKAIFTAMPVIPSIRNMTFASTATMVPPTINKRLNSLINFKGNKRESGRLAFKHIGDSPDLLTLTSTTSLPGPAATYAHDITHFCTEQARIVAAENADDYRKAVLALRELNTTIKVPVFFVKVCIIIPYFTDVFTTHILYTCILYIHLYYVYTYTILPHYTIRAVLHILYYLILMVIILTLLEYPCAY